MEYNNSKITKFDFTTVLTALAWPEVPDDEIADAIRQTLNNSRK